MEVKYELNAEVFIFSVGQPQIKLLLVDETYMRKLTKVPFSI